MADVFITREHREEIDFILYFKYETILCVLCGLIKSLNLGENYSWMEKRINQKEKKPRINHKDDKDPTEEIYRLVNE